MANFTHEPMPNLRCERGHTLRKVVVEGDPPSVHNIWCLRCDADLFEELRDRQPAAKGRQGE